MDEATLHDAELIAACAQLRARYEAEMEGFAFQNALMAVFGVIARANKYIDENAPWTLAKDMDANGARLAHTMYNLLETIRICATLLLPFTPDSCEKIFAQTGVGADGRTWLFLYRPRRRRSGAAQCSGSASSPAATMHFPRRI